LSNQAAKAEQLPGADNFTRFEEHFSLLELSERFRSAQQVRYRLNTLKRKFTITNGLQVLTLGIHQILSAALSYTCSVTKLQIRIVININSVFIVLRVV